MALSIGSLLAGRYEITAPIAVGGMGEVWKARDRVLDRIVAAKVLKSEFTGDPSFLARFRNEARHTAALTHPNIASVYDYGETVDDSGTQQLAFLVMEFVEGQPLVTILHDEGALPVDWTLHILSQSADGLSAAHKAGVVHRDIKPGNLMVRPDGVVKLTDFGIAQARDATPLTRTGMVVGTAQYLSPEQAQGMEVTAASDVYSLGVVGYECLAGARPFDGASQVAIALAHINRPPPPLPGHVPPAVRLLVERALAKDAAARFPEGGAFAEAIRRVAAGGTLAPTPVSGPRTTPTRILAGGAAVGGAVAAGGLAGGPATAASLAESRTQVIPATGTGAAADAGGPMTAPPGPMPPLQAPPEDDWLAEDDDGRRGGRGKWIWLSAAVVLLLLLAGGTWFLLADDNRGRDGAAAATTTTQTTAAPTGIQLDPAAFIGRPADDVQAELEAAGLVVRREEAGGDVLADAGQALDAGDVAGLDPSGVQAQPGSEVLLLVAADAFTPDDGDEPTSTPETTSTTTSDPTTSSAATTTTSPTPTTLPGSQEPTLPGSQEPTPEEPPVEPTPVGEPPPADAAS
jgi:serine/threonine-protein kinase